MDNTETSAPHAADPAEHDHTGPDPVAALAAERFGIPCLMPLQRFVVANILDSVEGEKMRQMVLLPTGFGKSLCFQLPSLLLPRPTLVVYPLLALMADQKRSLDAKGIGSALFRGGMESGERRQAERDVESGAAKIIITNPESLARGQLADFLKSVKPSHVAIDEAHCVSEWGETFRPSYLDLGRIVEELDPPAVSAFTATASPTVSEAISRIIFGAAPYRLVAGDPDRPNIHFSVVRTLCREHTVTRLAASMRKPLIVFCSSRETTQILAQSLRERIGPEVRFYHAGLERAEKKTIESWFMESKAGILIATCAYGMGVDKSDVRSVIHYEAPPSVEAYLQEAGRAGRDRENAEAVLIVQERGGAGRCAETDPVREKRRRLMAGYGKAEGCRREELMRMMGAEPGSVLCSGCDVCEGRARNSAEGMEELLDFFGRNGRRHNKKASILLLSGKGKAGLRRCAGSGSLSGWEMRDLALLVASGKQAGILGESGSFPWKGKLFLTRRGLALRRDRRAGYECQEPMLQENRRADTALMMEVSPGGPAPKASP